MKDTTMALIDMDDQSPQAIISSWISAFKAALSSTDADAVVSLFHSEGWWKDFLNIDFDFNAFQTSEIKDALARFGFPNIKNLALARPDEAALIAPGSETSWIQGHLSFHNETCRGRGLLRLKQDKHGNYRAYTLFTALWEVKGLEDFVEDRRPLGTIHGHTLQGRKNWLDKRKEQSSFEKADPVVLIVGAGQNGLMVGARLNALGIPNLIIDKNENVGDNWANRYHTLTLHDPVWANHFAYLPFPPQWPIYTPKDKLAQFMKSYADIMELNVWNKATLDKGTTYDPQTGKWTVRILREGQEPRTMKISHLVQATGFSGEPRMPDFKGKEDFKGKIYHSSQHKSGREFSGKKAIVVGCCNSGHDIASDLYENGADVTIVQRSWTYVMTSKNGIPELLKGVYEEHGPPTEDADLMLTSWPLEELAKHHRVATAEITKQDRPLLDGLKKAGFKVNPYPDGLFMKYYRDGGGYYIDVGCSQLIADGKVKIKQGQEIDRILPNGIRFADGEEREADLIVCATGYGSMRDATRRIIGDEFAEKLKATWGSDKQGEISGAWRNNGVPGLWLACGNLVQARCYSKYIALQIQLIELGLAKKENPYPEWKYVKSSRF